MFKRELAIMITSRFKMKHLEKETGKSRQAFHAYLKGTRSPDKSTAQAWALAMGLEKMALWDESLESEQKQRKKAA
jgi:hypothetical protein